MSVELAVLIVIVLFTPWVGVLELLRRVSVARVKRADKRAPQQHYEKRDRDDVGPGDETPHWDIEEDDHERQGEHQEAPHHGQIADEVPG